MWVNPRIKSGDGHNALEIYSGRHGKVQVSVSARDSRPQENAKIGRLAGIELKVDRGAKSPGMAVRHQKAPHDLALRRRRHDFDKRRVLCVIGKIAAGEIDQETARAGRHRLGRAERLACRLIGVHRAPVRRQAREVEARENPIGKGEGLAGLGRVLRHPGDDDIIVRLVLRRQFDKLDMAVAPIFFWLDPIARPRFIGEIEILVMVEIAVALEKTEAANVLIEKGRDLRARRIVQRAARSIRPCRKG